jgi:hypothetical protein
MPSSLTLGYAAQQLGVGVALCANMDACLALRDGVE